MNEKALLIGINRYKNISSLMGCHNDVDRMKEILIDVLDFPSDGLRVRLDEAAHKTQILDDMEWLIEGALPGERRLMHFSGHGSYTIDRDNEADEGGQDELLCLYNMDWDDPESYLLDDEIADFTRRVPQGVQLVLVFDSCHSGTGSRAIPTNTARGLKKAASPGVTLVKELASASGSRTRGNTRTEPFLVRFAQPPADIIAGAKASRDPHQHALASTRAAVTVPGLNHVLLAGAADDQTAADAHIDNDYFGAFTYYLTKSWKDLGADVDRTQLINQIDQDIVEYTQNPQLEAASMTGPLFAEVQESPTTGNQTSFQIEMPSEDRVVSMDRDVFLQLLATYNRLLDLATNTLGAKSRTARAGTTGIRQLVTVHGIGKHLPGYSDGWWKALNQNAPSLAPGELNNDQHPTGSRHEVNWSNLVNRSVRDARSNRQTSRVAEEIKGELQDRADAASMPLVARGVRAPDTRGVFGNFFSSIDDFAIYLTDRTRRDLILDRFFTVVRPLLQRGDKIEIISHSWGTVVAYEGLILLERQAANWPGRVHNFFTVGSALSILPVRHSLIAEASDRRKPSMVDRWINLNARYDMVGGRLMGNDRFDVQKEFLNLDPTNCNPFDPGCAHSSYFDKDNTAVNHDIFGKFIES